MAAGRGWGLSPIRQFTPAVRLPENGFLLNLSVPLTTIKDFTTTVRERKNDFSLRSPLCVCVGGGQEEGRKHYFIMPRWILNLFPRMRQQQHIKFDSIKLIIEWIF